MDLLFFLSSLLSVANSVGGAIADRGVTDKLTELRNAVAQGELNESKAYNRAMQLANRFASLVPSASGQVQAIIDKAKRSAEESARASLDRSNKIAKIGQKAEEEANKVYNQYGFVNKAVASSGNELLNGNLETSVKELGINVQK